MTNWADDIGKTEVLKDGVSVGSSKTINLTGSGVSAAVDPTTGAVTMAISGGGGGTVTAVASLAALRAVTGQSDLQQGSVASPLGVWVYSTTSGAGFADDGATVVKPTAVSLGSNGRWYNTAAAPVVPTYAALLLAGSGKQASVIMQAYATLGDGGGGTWHWSASSTATANVGTVVQATGVTTGRWLRDTDGSLNAKWFGAKGDGTGNDAPALNAMFLFALTSAKAYYIQIPRGVYNVASTVMIRGTFSVNFIVEGEAGGNAAATNGTTLNWTGAAGGTVVDCPGSFGYQLRHLDIKCNSLAKYGIWFRPDRVSEGGTSEVGCSSCEVDKVFIYSPQNVAGASCIAVGPPTYGNGNTQTDTICFSNCVFWGQPADINQQAVGFINLAGNNTKIFRFYECGFLFLRFAIDIAISSGPITLFGCQMGHIREAVFRDSGAVVTAIDMNAEGCAALVVGGSGGGNGYLLFINCEGVFGDAENITGTGSSTHVRWMVDTRGGRIKFLGGRFFNYRTPAIGSVTTGSPIVCTTTGPYANHGYVTGDRITIGGAQGIGIGVLNGQWVVTVLSTTTFSLATVAGVASNGAGMTYTASTAHATAETRMRIVSQQPSPTAIAPNGFSSEGVTWGGAVETVPVYGNDDVRISDPAQARAAFLNGRSTPFMSVHDVSQTDNLFNLLPETRTETPLMISLPAGVVSIGVDGAMSSARTLAARTVQVDAITATTGTITNVSAGAPNRVVSTAHGRTTGDVVLIAGVVGNSVNGEWTITVIDANNFDLIGSRYFGSYVSGGTWTLIRPGTPVKGLVRIGVTPTFASIAAGAVGTTTVTVTGADSIAGDMAFAQPTAALQAGLVVLDARVSATNTVTLSILNTTAGALTPTSVAWNVKVEKF